MITWPVAIFGWPDGIPTDCQSPVGDIANWRLEIGVRRYLCTKSRPARSSALIGRWALISRPDSAVGGKLAKHSYHVQLIARYTTQHLPRIIPLLYDKILQCPHIEIFLFTLNW